MELKHLPYRLRTARQKKRLVKLDFDKQLIQINKKQNHLSQQRRDLPMVPLAQPYQRGWKRLFTLREDTWLHPKAMFYLELLNKINTVQYDTDKAFKRKKRRKAKYGYQEREQKLHDLEPYLFHSDRLKLTDNEREFFVRTERWHSARKYMEVRYVFTEPWRYVLKVVPHMVSEVKQLDHELEKEEGKLDRFIRCRHLKPRIYCLTTGRRWHYRWRGELNERAKYINEFKNIARYRPKEAYLD